HNATIAAKLMILSQNGPETTPRRREKVSTCSQQKAIPITRPNTTEKENCHICESGIAAMQPQAEAQGDCQATENRIQKRRALKIQSLLCLRLRLVHYEVQLVTGC